MHLTRIALVSAVAAAGASLAACGTNDSSGSEKASRPAAGATRLVEVPRLVGRRQEDAHRVADAAGLQLRWTGFTGQYGNGRFEIGCVKVLRQSPAPGTRRPRGAQIAVIETGCRVSRYHPHVL